jgi:hypothetical protein
MSVDGGICVDTKRGEGSADIGEMSGKVYS